MKSEQLKEHRNLNFTATALLVYGWRPTMTVSWMSCNRTKPLLPQNVHNSVGVTWLHFHAAAICLPSERGPCDLRFRRLSYWRDVSERDRTRCRAAWWVISSIWRHMLPPPSEYRPQDGVSLHFRNVCIYAKALGVICQNAVFLRLP